MPMTDSLDKRSGEHSAPSNSDIDQELINGLKFAYDVKWLSVTCDDLFAG
jgi:hypothetical protein